MPMCIGVRCDLCGELDCPRKTYTVEGLKLCPVCRYRLNLTATKPSEQPEWHEEAA